MRTVFSNSMCMHVYAQQKQEHGRGFSVSFSGPLFFDRSTPVARIIPATRKRERVNLITCHSYSVTTNGHLSQLSRSMPDGHTFRVPSLGASGGRYYSTRDAKEKHGKPDHRANLAYLVEQYTIMRDAARKATRYWEWRLDTMENLAATARHYASLFGLREPDIDCAYDAAKERARRAEAARIAADPAVALKRQRRADRAAAKRERDAVGKAYARGNRYSTWRERERADLWLAEVLTPEQVEATNARSELHYTQECVRKVAAGGYVPQHERERAETYLASLGLTEEQSAASEERERYVRMVYEAWRMDRERTDRLARAAAAADRIAAWLAGENAHISSYETDGALLRVKPSDPSIVETSRGAEVPVADARRLYSYVNAGAHRIPEYDGGFEVRDGVSYPTRTLRIGHFTLTKIESDNTLHIGCHILTWTECTRFAQSQGW